MKKEMARWKATWAEEMERNDEHLDRKIEILSRGIDICEDENNNKAENISKISEQKFEELAEENEKLRRQITQLMREVESKSPIKPSFSSSTARNRERAQSRVLRESANGSNLFSTSTTASTVSTSPSKSASRPTTASSAASAMLSSNLERLRIDDGVENLGDGGGNVKRSPSKKFRKLPVKKWDMAGEDEEMF